MNIAVIFAGGVGSRMGNDEIPKQFIEIDNKPILIHTLDKFENNENIDGIVISILGEWLDYTNDLIKKYNITKVKHVTPGGDTGQMSIFNGLKVAYENFPSDSTVLIHDGVRPFITEELINDNINSVKEFGSAVSCVGAIETFIVTDVDKNVTNIPERDLSMIAKAPQSFVLGNIYNVHLEAQKDGIFNSIDSCTLMNYYKQPIKIVMTNHDNIKITTPKDIGIAESLYRKEKELNEQ